VINNLVEGVPESISIYGNHLQQKRCEIIMPQKYDCKEMCVNLNNMQQDT